MDNFTYQSPTKYVFGRGAEEQTGNLAKSLGCRKALIVYGQGSVIRSGLLDRVKNSLAASGIEYCELGGVQPNPIDTLVRRGIELCRAEKAGLLLAVGGGSAIDTAKAIAAGAVYDGDFWDFYCGKKVIDNALPVGVVLTIPAAGSEGSGNSVITNVEKCQKISLRTDYWLRPKFAVLNPELTMTLPMAQTAAGIADMMAHIMERYFTPTPDVEVTDRLCEGLLKAIMDQASIVVKTPDDYQARANIMWSATLAHNGICGCGRREDWASHGLEHVLSALYGVTHGTGLAVVFPAWMTYMASKKLAKIAQFARRVMDVVCDDDTQAALEGIARLKTFYTSLGLPVTLEGLGIKDYDIKALASHFHLDKGTPAGAYLPLYPADTEAIYKLMV